VRLVLARCVVRDWDLGDVRSLVRHANNRRIWMNLRDRFPHPYTDADGQAFLASAATQVPSWTWAIEVDGEAAGGIGLSRLADIERVSAEIGYWLGEAYWGRGITTEAVTAVTAAALSRGDLSRIFALPFADNVASIRVLEKAGYALEGRLPQSAIKDGVIRDQLMFGAYRLDRQGGVAEWGAPGEAG
jgi:RimJ/RimL family protein N-acetyltransferase